MLNEGERERLLAPLAAHDHVLLAVSGGPDSIALMHLAALWRAAAPGRPALAVATFDHGLRPESAAEAARVASLAARLGLPHAVLRWDGAKPRTGLQERARTARYAALVAHARAVGAGALATAHHADDQMETVLMRLARGSGPGGLAGMRPASRMAGLPLLRPLLGTPKAALVAHCRAAGLAFVDDPSNADPRFARARARALAATFRAAGMADARWGALAARAARADDALQALTERALAALPVVRDTAGTELPFAALAREPDEIVLRALALELARLRERVRPLRLERLEAAAGRLRAAAQAGAALTLSLGGVVMRLNVSGRLRLSPEEPRRRGRLAAPAPELVHAIDQKQAPNALEDGELCGPSLGNGPPRA